MPLFRLYAIAAAFSPFFALFASFSPYYYDITPRFLRFFHDDFSLRFRQLPVTAP